MPQELVNACIRGQVVLFAGAGISTESHLVMPTTFYEDVAGELGVEPETTTFPAVMERYVEACGQPALLQRIRQRFDYIGAFPELYREATRFHQHLSSIHFLQNIVTTNWDTGFEDMCGALPLVVPDDYAFWDVAGRKVLKIHGSISNWGTVVATQKDYDRCHRRLRNGVIGASLKHLLATKRALFVGYSLRDPDFRKIYNYLKHEMGEILPRSFAYIDGYVNGLLSLLVDEKDLRYLPLYYVFGAGELRSFTQYQRAAKQAEDLHKTSYRVARKLVAGLREDTTVLHHTPFLR